MIVVAIGVNNFRDNNAEEIAEGIRLIIRTLKKKSPSATILLLGPFPAGENEKDPLRIRYRNVHQLIAPLGELESVIYKNIGSPYILEDGTLDYTLMRADNIHLAPKGYYIWAESIQPEIDNIFGLY